MTGSDILAQVRHALGNSTEFEEWAVNNNVLAALDGCVLLTANEAAGILGKTYCELSPEQIALLTPKETP